jgi:hypothetical protein
MPENFGFYQPVMMELAVPDGPPEYKAGWHAGCKTALSNKAFANASVYQDDKGATFGKGVYNHDPMYQTAWGQAYFACYTTVSEFVGRPVMQFAPLD